MRRIETEKRQVPGGGAVMADDPLDARRAALRRAVDQLGEATTRLRTQAGDVERRAPLRRADCLGGPGRHRGRRAGPERAIARRPLRRLSLRLPQPPRASDDPRTAHRAPMRSGDVRLRWRQRSGRRARRIDGRRSPALRVRLAPGGRARADDHRGGPERDRVRADSRRASRRAPRPAGARSRSRSSGGCAAPRWRPTRWSSSAAGGSPRSATGSSSSARSLAGRLAEADQVKGQFDTFVHSLSQASDRLATVSSGSTARTCRGCGRRQRSPSSRSRPWRRPLAGGCTGFGAGHARAWASRLKGNRRRFGALKP